MPMNSELEEKVNAAIDKLLENKTIEALIDKYFK
jgi:ABC-type amino acid transport substrate-binding protein